MAGTTSSRWPSRTTLRLAVVLGYIAVALWSTWPLALHSHSTVPMTTMRVGTVPLFNLWTIWWNADRLQHGLQHYWSAPIFHPATDTFAFSEAQPVTMLVAPIIWATGSRELAYNGYLWMSLVLNALFAERLLRHLRIVRPLAIAGGFAMLMLPLVHLQLEVLQLVPIWGVLWTWAACSQLGRIPTRWRGIEVGLAFGLTFLTCAHQGLLLSFLLACTIGILLSRPACRATWSALAIATVVAAIIVAPYAWKLHRAVHRDEFRRSDEVVSQLSAKATHYLEQTGVGVFETRGENGSSNRGLNPGWIKVALAIWGVGFGLMRRSRTRWTVFLMAVGLLSLLLSCGPNMQLGHWQPWSTLTQVWPGFAHVRSVFRFAFFVQMVAVLLAVQGLYGLWVLNRRYAKARAWQTGTQWLLLACAVAATIETRPAPLVLFNTPHAKANAQWIGYLRDHAPVDRGIACLPFPDGDSVGSYEHEARWMYYGTYHGQPLANGYSGFFPAEYFALQDAINAKFPSEAALRKLVQANVALIVINRRVMNIPDDSSLPIGPFMLTRVFHDEIGIDIYRLE